MSCRTARSASSARCSGSLIAASGRRRERRRGERRARARALEKAVRAVLEQLARGLRDGVDRREREGAADRDALDAGRGELAHRRRARIGEHVDGPADLGHDAADVLDPRQAGRVEHVGAGLAVGAQAGDRVVEVVAAVEVVLGARGEDEVDAAGVRRLGGRGDPLHRRRDRS